MSQENQHEGSNVQECTLGHVATTEVSDPLACKEAEHEPSARDSANASGASDSGVIERLMKRIAELEEKLYQQELQAPIVPESGRLSKASIPVVNIKPEPASPCKDAKESKDSPKFSADWMYGFSFTGRKRPGSTNEKAVHTEKSANDACIETAHCTLSETPSDGREVDISGITDRYICMDPADIVAEREVHANVKKAAAELVLEANRKIRAAEEAQHTVEQRLAALRAAMELEKDVKRLKEEIEQSAARRKQLEDELLRASTTIEATRQENEVMTKELDNRKLQDEIWRNDASTETDKMKQENGLLKAQLQARLDEMKVVTTRNAELDAERQILQRNNKELEELVALQSKQLEDLKAQIRSFLEQATTGETAVADSARWQNVAQDAQEKFLKERNIRRRLHDQLQCFKGNVRVMCRVKPPLESSSAAVTIPLDGQLCITPADGKKAQEFEFDTVFGPSSSQEDVFSEVRGLVKSCLSGHNICVFAYGQTGSGKTYTMLGTAACPGIAYQASAELLRLKQADRAEKSFTIEMALMRVQNEQAFDLLRPTGEHLKALEVSGLPAGELRTNMERVTDLTWQPVETTEDFTKSLSVVHQDITIADGTIKPYSSRCHTVCVLRVLAKDADGHQQSSMMSIVDLAGSERVEKSEGKQMEEHQLKESQLASKSLATIGDVLSCLQRRQTQIPCRDSRLTSVLQDCLCGSAKVLLLCTISSEATAVQETLSTLSFASRAAQVELGIVKRAMELMCLTNTGHSSPTPSASSTPRTPGKTWTVKAAGQLRETSVMSFPK